MLTVNFESFGIEEKKRRIMKISGIVELSIGVAFILFSLLYFGLLLGYVCENDTLINTFSKVFGINEGSGAFSVIYAICIGAVFVSFGIIATISGVQILKISKNPILFLESKVSLISMAILYAVFFVLFVICFFFYIGIVSILLLILGVISVVTIASMKFYLAKTLPDKNEVLKYENLSEEARKFVEMHAVQMQKKKSRKTKNKTSN